MSRKAQHADAYTSLPGFLRQLRGEAELPQRALGARLERPQSWVHNCETGMRRVDVTEFIAWAEACDVDAIQAFRRLLKSVR